MESPMPSGPFDVDLDPALRLALTRRLRDLLEESPLDVGAMAARLGVEPELVVVALRELRVNPEGRVRSAIRLGHVSWWWERLAVPVPAPRPVEAAGRAEDEVDGAVGADHRRKHKGKHKKG
jgi:hypothetical protein